MQQANGKLSTRCVSARGASQRFSSWICFGCSRGKLHTKRVVMCPHPLLLAFVKFGSSVRICLYLPRRLGHTSMIPNERTQSRICCMYARSICSQARGTKPRPSPPPSVLVQCPERQTVAKPTHTHADRLLVAGCWCLVPGAWCLVPGAWSLVPGLVPGAWCLVPGAWCLVPGAWCRVPGAGCRVLGLVPGAWCLVPGAWCLLLVACCL